MFTRQRWKQAMVRLMVYSIATVSLILASPAIYHSIAWGQLPALTAPSTAQPLPIGVERRGTLESAEVRLDGQTLFRVAAPTVLNRSDPGSQIPVEVRAKQIEANLEQLITTNYWGDNEGLNPDSLTVSIETINGHPVLFVKDASLAEAKVLLTVTAADAQYAAVSKDRLAERWQEILEQELRQALALRQPEALRQQVSTVIKVAIATVLLTSLLGAIWMVLGRRRHQLQQQLTAPLSQSAAVAEPTGPDAKLRLLPELRQHFGLQQRLQIVQFLRWLTFWTIALVWAIGISYSLNLFPQTRQFAQKVIAIPLALLIAWFLTGLMNRLTDFGIDRFIQNREQDQCLTEANLQRIATIARAIKGLKIVLLYTVVIIWLLQWLRLIPGSILTLGALVALAISFTAQNLVKDIVNGFLILLEDQFRIGDNVRINEVSGMVENLNLRITQIRSDAGSLITLPNSQIAEVENRSRSWSRTDFRVEVAYDTDVDRALAVVRETVDKMAADPEWQSVILDTHELFGVDEIAHTGIVIRVWLRTLPLQQWSIARELRRRLKIAFDRHQIQIGMPQQMQIQPAPTELHPLDASLRLE